ncbi:solute carrier family 35 member E4 [Grus americana]|nr:solute carrier family 35 member E4 [Grus americana]XP_054699953.1 solute carrier family 35 member E4 [Grus americana]XP_054699954.1 solute carrier family 35 member E4 [Grus americana]XP_054699956.1 solute carrier family 35 member E4 [Grus americana]
MLPGWRWGAMAPAPPPGVSQPGALTQSHRRRRHGGRPCSGYCRRAAPAGMRGCPFPAGPAAPGGIPGPAPPQAPPCAPAPPYPAPGRPVTRRRPRGEEPPSLRSPPSSNFPLAPGHRRCLPRTWHRRPGAEPCHRPRAGDATVAAGRSRGPATATVTAADSRGRRLWARRGRTGQSGEWQREGAEPVPMCPRSRRGDEAAMTAGEGTLRPWKPDPGQAQGGRPPPGPSLPLTLTVLAWLGTGTTMAGLNKWIFATHGFRYPLLLSSLHMLSGVAVGYPLGWARGPSSPAPRPRARIYLLSLTFCTSVALGNLGLSYVQLDVAQAVATTTPLVTLLLSGLLGGRRHHPLQYVAMGPVCAGAACSIAGGLRFYQPGCGFLLAATVLRALKSVQQSVLLQQDRLDALSLLCLTSLPSFCLLFGAAVALEVGPSWQGVLRYDGTLWACVLLSCLGSVLYNLATSRVLSLTSALTVHVLGNVTVVGNLLLSRLLFGSHLSGLSYLGIGLTLAGMFMYHQPDLIAARWVARPGRGPPGRE